MLLKVGLPLTEVIGQKCVLILLGLTTAASAADAGIHKKILGSGKITLIISNEERRDVLEIAEFLKEPGYGRLIKGAIQAI